MHSTSLAKKESFIGPVTRYTCEYLPHRSLSVVIMEGKVCDPDVQVIALLQRTPTSGASESRRVLQWVYVSNRQDLLKFRQHIG